MKRFGADTDGNLVCLACDHPREAGHYLCRTCWRALPARARASLTRRDRLALPRLRELIDQLRDGTPLDKIEVTP
ncbi:hypothetical protein PYK79_56410 [Streptomyces sp. ID05-04B]|uniref:hypothetical protein n=1 Tax=unclassified Streptomyces TaxID=2593676 RepID=UPI00131F4085|nr:MULTISPECIES: hypothetical protein [unclassified Streptomyces]MDX5570815.1 hypothetical protein [Streptomyces sp. ID05-04B]